MAKNKSSPKNILSQWREQIEDLDVSILKQIAQRRQIVYKIAAYKKSNSLPIPDRARESQLLQMMLTKAPVDLPEEWVLDYFAFVVNHSKKDQHSRPSRNFKKSPSSAQQKLVVVGLGLMGGSLIKGLQSHTKDYDLWSYDLDNIISLNGLCKKAKLRDIQKADIIILAVPVSSVMKYIQKIGPKLKPGALLMDLGSTKTKILAKAQQVLPDSVNFIGAHPLCGKERGGFENSVSTLYEGAMVVICPEKKCPNLALEKVQILFEKLGAKTQIMDASVHDRLMATSSHLPQMVALALTNINRKSFEQARADLSLLPNSLFLSLTRTASSPYSMWRSVFEQNQKHIQSALGEMIRQLQRFQRQLGTAALAKDFNQAQEFKNEILKENQFTVEAKKISTSSEIL